MRLRHLFVPFVALGLLNCSTGADEVQQGAPRTDAPRWIRPNPGVSFQRTGSDSEILPRLAQATKGADLASVRLPASATGAFTVRSVASTTAIEVTPVGTRATTATIEEGLVHYRGAFGSGTDTIHRVSAAGTEDFVRFETAPSRPELVYRVRLSEGVAGLRHVANSLEFIDASGTPRLRIPPPYGVDARGERFAAKLELPDCAADVSPAPPWDRAPTAPGSTTCSIRVTWPIGTRYPAVIDPAWFTSGTLAGSDVSYESYLTPLTGGKALAIVGGNVAQVFDPVTGTWATTGTPPFTFGHRDRILGIARDRVWTVQSGGATAATFTLATGTWATTVAPDTGSSSHALVELPNGKMLVFTDALEAFEVDLTANTKTLVSTGPAFGVTNLRAERYATTKYLISGGYSPKVMMYDSVAKTWKLSVADVFEGSQGNGTDLVALTNGKVLAVWGAGDDQRIWNPVTDTTSPVGGVVATTGLYHSHPGSTHASFGKVHYLNGGRYRYDETTNAIVDLGAFESGATQHNSVVRLAGGGAVAIGGGGATSDTLAPSSAADCTDATPIFNSGTHTCSACANDFMTGGVSACPSGSAPVCQVGSGNPLKGRCTVCSATKAAKCIGATPTCDVASGTCAGCNGGNGSTATRTCPSATSPVCKTDGSCVAANGDNGSTASQPCPTAANPYLKSDGTCGKCVTNADCAGPTHAGPICVAGACGTTCTSSTDCTSTQFCDATSRACLPKKDPGSGCTSASECASASCTAGKCDTSCTSQADCPATAYCAISASPKICKTKLADGAPCTSKDECVSAACTSGKCGAGTPAPDGGTDGGGKEPSPDGGPTNAPDSGSTGPVGGADAGANADGQPDGQSAESGCGCKTAGPSVGSAWPLALFFGAVFGLVRRRRR
jgi:hypothetical protein